MSFPEAPALAAIASRDGHRTLAELAYAVLHEAIVTGSLAPARRLPIEDLAEALGMSPMPVREALRRLDYDGLVENVPHRGARVTELAIGDLRDVYQARLALEPLAIREAALRIDDETSAGLRAALDAHVAAGSAGDEPLVWTTHTRFHFALYNASASRWLSRLITPPWESSERYRHAIPELGSIGARQAEHRGILDACIAGEADQAARELHDHLAVTANLLSKRMGGDELFPLEGDTVAAAAAAQPA